MNDADRPYVTITGDTHGGASIEARAVEHLLLGPPCEETPR